MRFAPKENSFEGNHAPVAYRLVCPLAQQCYARLLCIKGYAMSLEIGAGISLRAREDFPLPLGVKRLLSPCGLVGVWAGRAGGQVGDAGS